MRGGEYQEAVALYHTAESLWPDPRITRQREKAEGLDAEFKRLVGEEQDLFVQREKARKALAERRYPEALAAAQAVLTLRPGDEDAKKIFDKAQAEARRQQSGPQTAARGPARPESTPAAELTPSPSPAAEETVAPQKVYLHIVFYVEPSAEGTVRLFQNDRVLWQTDFKRKKAIFNKDEKNRTYTGTAEVAPGATSLKVTVSLGGRDSKTISKTLPPSELTATSHRLEIHLLEDRKNISLNLT